MKLTNTQKFKRFCVAIHPLAMLFVFVSAEHGAYSGDLLSSTVFSALLFTIIFLGCLCALATLGAYALIRLDDGEPLDTTFTLESLDFRRWTFVSAVAMVCVFAGLQYPILALACVFMAWSSYMDFRLVDYGIRKVDIQSL